MSVITVYSGAYCGASEVVAAVVERLGYTRAGDELLADAARRSGLTPERIARAVSGERSLWDAFTREFDKSLIHLRASLAEALQTDRQLLHSPAALLVPPGITHVLRVEVTADRTRRVETAMRREGVDHAEAEARVERSDQAVERWTRELTARGLWDPDTVDIRIPLPATPFAEAVDAICHGAQAEVLLPTAASLQAVRDFQLAARVRVALLDGGQHDCEIEATGGAVTVIHTQRSGPGALSRTVHALRYEALEEEATRLVATFDGVTSVVVRPGTDRPRAARTLLVDDEHEYVMTLSERLQMRGLESAVVHDGEQALTVVRTDAPDVMVLDLRMPGIDGMEVLRRTKAEHPEVEVIIVTGHGTEDDERLARELGAFDYLRKPVDIGELSEKIRAAEHKVLAARDEREEGGE